MLSLFSARSIGFSGSRSPSLADAAALCDLLPFVPSGSRVSVGCADGVDRLVRDFFSGSPSLLVFSVASGNGSAGILPGGWGFPFPPRLSCLSFSFFVLCSAFSAGHLLDYSLKLCYNKSMKLNRSKAL